MASSKIRRRGFLGALAALPCVGMLKPAECCDTIPDEITCHIELEGSLPSNVVFNPGEKQPLRDGDCISLVYNGRNWLELARTTRWA